MYMCCVFCAAVRSIVVVSIQPLAAHCLAATCVEQQQGFPQQLKLASLCCAKTCVCARFCAPFPVCAHQITWHKESGDPVSEHLVRVPRDAVVGDALGEVARQVGTAAAGKPLRLLEVHSSKIYKVSHWEPVDCRLGGL